MDEGDYKAEEQAKRIQRSAYIWNTASGLLTAFQSVVILVVVTRVCDVTTAGVFTLAYANANLFLNVGKFGMRQFQASDPSAQYSFSEYRASRIATVFAMLLTSSAYLAFLSSVNDYSVEKAATIGVFCLYEAVVAFEDVFFGNFQQHGRLDVAARLLTVRAGSALVVLCIVIALSRSLLFAVILATVYILLFLVGELAFAKKRYGLPASTGVFEARKVCKLLIACFPLFAAAFLLFYIGNAPRYAIDASMGDAYQAYYGYIARPVFVVTLLASLIYNPIITSMADQWLHGHLRAFCIRLGKVALAIVGITACCDLAAFLFGVPVLDYLYNADTAPYLGDLIVLVTGGGFLAMATLAVLGITIIRFQRVLVPVYAVVAIGAWAISGFAVSEWGITGAAWAYFTSMTTLAIILVALFFVGVRVQNNALSKTRKSSDGSDDANIMFK